MTTWRVVAHHPRYSVSDDGQVRGVYKQLTPSLRGGYPSVLLYGGEKPQRFSVHILMLEAFVHPRPSGMQGMHRDDNPFNNVLSNLAWGTPAQNIATRNSARGERQGVAKLTSSDVRDIRRAKHKKSLSTLATEFGVCKSTVARVLRKDSWKHI